ncbi:MAG TPA: glycerol-3-phosphate 1-O-acyltransferase PlsY [Syntrophomonadaceae bacterium]|nr:glycerol-3-phosphate 1-O-acyltransferase PlsY [Syntrophomonadaceae bacterium]
MKFILLIIASYLIGAIPCGYLVGRLHGVDIRNKGSGNIGTTNVFRILGPKPGLIVFVCDVIKGLIPVLIAKSLGGPGWGVAAGLAAVVGHNWSIFLGFRGGRGVATGAGVLVALMPKVVLIAFGIWVVVVLISRYVSLGSIIAALSVPVIALIYRVPGIYYIFAIPAPLFIVYRHIQNIDRIRKGTESRLRIW